MSTKHEYVYRELRDEIIGGLLVPGAKMSTEREFSERFKVSRPTIRQALARLEMEGLIVRKVGSGTYVAGNGAAPSRHLSLGLLVPGLGRGEIFEPLCTRIAELSQAYDYTLAWGSSAPKGRVGHTGDIVQTAQRFAEQGLDGVFFQPVELVEQAGRINREVVSVLKSADVPFVLIDADFVPFPERSPFDLVCIDNVRAAREATKHLCVQGAERVDFVWRPGTAGSADYRRLGYRVALLEEGIVPSLDWEHELAPEDSEAVEALLASGATDIVCANDETAVLLMRAVRGHGRRCPEDVRFVGFDDVKYSRLVEVPLTTIRQPCNDLAEVAVQTLLSRIASPQLPPRTVSIDGRLMVRQSSQRKS